MDSKNRTLAMELILLGFSKDPNTNIMLFMVFLLIYYISINANCLIFCLILININLHIPMYFFLCILSLMDLCMVSSSIPKLLVDLLSGQGVISLAACTAQFYITLLMAGTECLLLALMAYDRYVAICRPLHYLVLMRWSNCYRMTAFVWILSFMIFILPYIQKPVRLCYPNQINHFMCEALVVTQLVCEDAHSSHISIVISVACFLALFLPFLLILVSYICILSSVLKMRSIGRAKAFSTCTSHVMVVVLFYGTAVVMYLGTLSQYSTYYGKYYSLLTIVICPTLNPLIYCFNNKDVRKAQRKLFSQIFCNFFFSRTDGRQVFHQ